MSYEGTYVSAADFMLLSLIYIITISLHVNNDKQTTTV